jgi:hypothetical protein
VPLRTNVYVDAFNVYYGCTKDTSYRWLNLARLCEVMLTNSTINQIKVRATSGPPGFSLAMSDE